MIASSRNVLIPEHVLDHACCVVPDLDRLKAERVDVPQAPDGWFALEITRVHGDPRVEDVVAEDREAEGVECVDCHLGACRLFRDPVDHLLRRLLREGKGEDGSGVDSVFDEVDDLFGNDTGLARPRPGEDQLDACCLDCLVLAGVEHME